MTRIVIVNCGDECNRGVAAIHYGAIHLLRRIVPSAALVLRSIYSAEEAAWRDAFRFSAKRFSGVEFAPAPVRSPYCRGLGRRVWGPIETWSAGSKGRLHAWCDALSDADLVVTRSSPLLTSSSYAATAGVWCLGPLQAARRIGVAYGFGPESFHPLRGIVVRRTIRKIGDRLRFAFCRDRASIRVLEGLGIRAEYALDLAFWIEPRGSREVRELSDRLGLRAGRFFVAAPRVDMDKDAATTMIEVSTLLVQRYGLQCVVVPHAVGGRRGEVWDVAQAERVARTVPDAIVLREEFDPETLAGMYGQAALLVGARVHSLLLALRAGTPVLGIPGDGRAEAILGALGVGRVLRPSAVAGVGEEARRDWLLREIEIALAVERSTIHWRIQALREESQERLHKAIAGCLEESDCEVRLADKI